MPIFNNQLTFRPLLSGLQVFGETAREFGTIGLFADGFGERWLVTALHVVSPAGGFAPGQRLFQPDDLDPPVGDTVAAMADAALDVVAVRLRPSALVVDEVLGLGVLGSPVVPTVGMRVQKVGAQTGLTEGLVSMVAPDRIEIGRPSGFPIGYDLGQRGDSGAVWVTADTHAPVAIHTGVSVAADRLARATRVDSALALLGLSSRT